MILQNWHPRFYRDLLEGAGYEQGDRPSDVAPGARRAEGRRSVRRLDPRRRGKRPARGRGDDPQHRQGQPRGRDAPSFAEVYNEAWADNWGFVPPTEAEIEFHAKLLKQVIDERWAFVAEREGETVGVALTLPDINQVLAQMGGRLLPLGWLTFLREQAEDRPGPRLRARRQARLSPHRCRRRPLPQASRGRQPGRRPGRRDGLDPGDERADEQGDGRHGRQDRQALSDVREGALRKLATCGASGRPS